MSAETTYYDCSNMENDREGLIKYELDRGRIYYQLHDNESTGKEMSKTKRLTMTLCILLTEMCERLTYYSIVANLIMYGKNKLGYTEVVATTINQIFSGFVFIVPILGGFVADAYVGRFRTILISGFIYSIGLVLIPLSAIDFETWGGSNPGQDGKRALFLGGLFFVALGTGGIKANVGPFGAEQVQSMGKEAVQSFFNWFYWVINVGAFIAYAGVSYIQQEVSFAWGYFVPLLSMALALFIFVIARKSYVRTEPQGSVLVEVFGVCRQGCCKSIPPANDKMEEGSERKLMARAKESYGGNYPDRFVDGVSSVVKVIPFCILVVIYWSLYTQTANTFYVQGCRMDVRLSGGVNVPVAALNVFNTIAIIVLIPVVDRLLYPFFQRIGKPLTYLKRMGIGMVLISSSMFVAGIVEIERKKGGYHEQILSGDNYNASSISVFAQIPQFALIGTSEIFTSITALEFAYNQAPVAMQGVLTGLFLAASGLGNWVSSALLLIVEEATKDDPWWGNEINHTNMEYLLFLLGGLMVINFFIFCIVAHYYSYQDPSAFEEGKDDGKETTEKSTDFGVDHTEKQIPPDAPPTHDNPGYGSTESYNEWL